MLPKYLEGPFLYLMKTQLVSLEMNTACHVCGFESIKGSHRKIPPNKQKTASAPSDFCKFRYTKNMVIVVSTDTSLKKK